MTITIPQFSQGICCMNVGRGRSQNKAITQAVIAGTQIQWIVLFVGFWWLSPYSLNQRSTDFIAIVLARKDHRSVPTLPESQGKWQLTFTDQTSVWLWILNALNPFPQQSHRFRVNKLATDTRHHDARLV